MATFLATQSDLDQLPRTAFGASLPGQDALWISSPSCPLRRQVPSFVDNEQYLTATHRHDAWRDDPHHCSEISYVVLHDAQIVEEWLVLDRHRRWFSPLIPPFPRSLMEARGVLPGEGSPPRARVRHDRTHHVSGDTVLLPVTSPSISHLLFEGLGCLGQFSGLSPSILLLTHLPAAFVELIERTGHHRDRVLSREPTRQLFSAEARATAWHFDRLIVPIYSFGLHPGMAPTFERIRRSSDPGTESELLYVSRFDALKRRVMLNEDEVAATVEKLGFRVLVCSDVPESEKLAEFASAKLIVGPLGAGLYNCLFSSIQTRIVALAAGLYIPHFLSLCASLKQQKYGLFYGPEFLSYDPHGQRGRCNNFVVNVPQLERRLTHLLDRSE
ncbi:MAG: glycosyltransferase family 61 protein [Myxococcales bacterium FL481]|nr:MAG: glycosyltransferase family 61 protein [Myxococcales bacterium FL481]